MRNIFLTFFYTLYTPIPVDAMGPANEEEEVDIGWVYWPL